MMGLVVIGLFMWGIWAYLPWQFALLITLLSLGAGRD